MIPQEIIDQVLDRADIVEVLSDYIQIKQAGRNFKGCCPFHNEKTPSFVVSPEKQIYHCFGCSAGGNVISFLMKYESMDFPEAVRALADRFGVEVPKERVSDGANDAVTQLYEINKLAAAYYHHCLFEGKDTKPAKYLENRKLDQNILKEFQIGYAPDAWESFKKLCETRKIPGASVRKAGLTISSEKGKGDYDRFRNRIIFPISNDRGNVVAFGARVMDDSLPKYINSPETPIYSKSNVLYGLNFSKKGIREKGFVVIVEGYLDVIVPYQYGVTNLVATSGTALTSRQVSLLKKYTKSAVMLFDADQAGEAASLRGLDILLEHDMEVKISTLPKGEDPDSFVCKYGKDEFEKILSGAKDLFDYKLDLLERKLGVKNIGGISDEMLPTLSKVQNAVVQSSYLRRLAQRLGVHEASLRHELGKVKPDYSYHSEEESKTDNTSYSYPSSEIHLLGLALTNLADLERVRSEIGVDRFCDASVRRAIDCLFAIYEEKGELINPGKLLSRMENDEAAKAAVVQALAKAEITQDREKALEDCIFYVKKENRDAELKSLTTKLKEAQGAKDNALISKLLVKINNIHKEKVA